MAIYRKSNSIMLSKNFESTEFDCNGKGCCNQTEIDPKLVEILQKIRDHFGASVVINSAYRCSKHNKSIGGASKSKHLYGQAADIKVSGVKPLDVARYAEDIGVNGIGLYSNFTHIDTRNTKFFWRGNEQDEVTTFAIKESDKKQNSAGLSGSQVKITGATVNVRRGPGTNYDVVTVAKKGQEFQSPNTDDWIPINVNGDLCWVSKTYAKEV